MKNALIIAILLISTACKTTQTRNAQTISDIKTTENYFSFYRGSCYGECPSYKITIKKDGSFVYNGRMHVENIGDFSGTLSNEQKEQIFKKIETLKWSSFPAEYPVDNVDFPSFKFEYANGQNLKSVKGNSNADTSLIAFGKQIDLLVKNLEMKKTK